MARKRAARKRYKIFVVYPRSGNSIGHSFLIGIATGSSEVEIGSGEYIGYPNTREDQINKILKLKGVHDISQKLLKEPLSIREIEVLELVGKGHADQQIADSLFISINTLRSHIKNICRKSDVFSKAQVISKAVQYKIIDL
jgi:DNA-binding CsgD family transcriptional regulator